MRQNRRMRDKKVTLEEQAGALFGRVRSEYVDGFESLRDAMDLGFRRTDKEFALVRSEMARFQNRVADRFVDVEQCIDQQGKELRAEMTAMGESLRGEMATMGESLRGEIATVAESLSTVAEQLTGEIRALGRRRGSGREPG